MNVYLINPRLTGEARETPLGIAYLAAVLRNVEGIEVTALDMDHEGYRDGLLEDEFIRKPPDMVGVSLLSNSLTVARNVFRLAKEVNKNCVTCAGGIHATVASEEVLAEWKELDVVVRGEGEEVFPKFVRSLRDGLFWGEIIGLSYRVNGKIVHNPRGQRVDLEKLPVNVHSFLPGNYRVRTVSSSRGCNKHCTFCSVKPLFGSRVRFRSSERIEEELVYLLRFNPQRIAFADDNFTSIPERVATLCERVKEFGLANKVELFAQGRCDDLANNPWMAKKMQVAGFKGIYLGAESGSQQILDYYKKEITPDLVLEAARVCLENGVFPYVNFILAGPKDTKNTIKETLSLMKKLLKMGAGISYAELLIPYPGTPIKKELEREKMFYEMGGFYYFKFYDSSLSVEKILKITETARRVNTCLGFTDREGEERLENLQRYFEIENIESLLEGRIPPTLEEEYSLAKSIGYLTSNVKEIYEEVKNQVLKK